MKQIRPLLLSCITLTSLSVLAACACPQTHEIQPIRDDDRNLDCKAVVMSITETEFIRKQADENKSGNINHIFNPLCYPSSYASAERAKEAAESRLQYLERIYDILDCGGKAAARGPRGQAPAPYTAYPATPAPSAPAAPAAPPTQAQPSYPAPTNPNAGAGNLPYATPRAGNPRELLPENYNNGNRQGNITYSPESRTRQPAQAPTASPDENGAYDYTIAPNGKVVPLR